VERGVEHFTESPASGERDLRAPRGTLLGSIRERARVEQRELRHTPGRLTQDLERDVTTHRQADQREARRSRGEDPSRHGAHAVVAGVVRDRHRPQAPQMRNLICVQPRRTQETRDQYGGNGLGHIFPVSDCTALDILVGRSRHPGERLK
jgi:hypothetical protein